MKISYNWLREYVNTDLRPEEISEILTQTGLEVEGVEKYEPVPGGMNGLIVGEVLETSKHPNADRLTVTKVDLGENEPKQIICGAPNVAAGQKVIVASVGATIYPVSGDPIKIKKGKIRGEVSEGMICAEDEIGVGTSHDGIMVLEPTVKVGSSASEYFDFREDYTIEIGLTPNRTDGTNHIGIARDLVAALRNMEGIERQENAQLQIPSIDDFVAGETANPIEVILQNKEQCPRYCGLYIQGVEVGPSPEWLQHKLKAIGLSPINNIVDITNFVLHETGQPLHAFDAAKITGSKVVVTNLKDQTPFITLDEVERKLNAYDLMICNSDALSESSHASAGMCIAGVFGGIHSGVSDNTKDVFLESAYFNPVSIRKTAKSHGLNTDASFRFERGVDPDGCIYALKRAALLIAEVAGGSFPSPVIDAYPNPASKKEVTFSYKRVNSLVGQEIPEEKVKQILADLDIEMTSSEGENQTVKVPNYRVDVTREADIAEEILRIYGYNAIDFPDKLNASLSYSDKPDREKLQNSVADMLAARGYNECISNSLSNPEYYNSDSKSATQVKILNPQSGDLSVMRKNLLFGMLETVRRNQNQRNNDLSLFEFGSEYRKHDSGYDETVHLAMAVTGDRYPESWNNAAVETGFTDIASAVESVFLKLGVRAESKEGSGNEFFEEFVQFSTADRVLGYAGSVSNSLLKSHDVSGTIWYADINWDEALRNVPSDYLTFEPLPKFPEMRRDLSLLIDKSTNYSQIEEVAMNLRLKPLRSINLFDVYEGKELPDGKKSYAVSFIFRDDKKTMTDIQADKLMERVLDALKKDLGASLR